MGDSEMDNEKNSKMKTCWEIVRSLRIEPVMFLFMFSYILNGTCLTNMIMDKGCLYHLNFSEAICRNLSNYKDEKDEVEILTNNYVLYLNLLAPIGAVVVIFLAPWSDKYGRKVPLLFSMFGFIVKDVGMILCVIYFYWRIEMIILWTVPCQMAGDMIGVMTIIYSYSSETSTDESRSLKYTYVQVAFGIAVTLGALAGGQLYRFFGYLVVYETIAACHVATVLWIIFFVPETQGSNNDVGCGQKLKDIIRSQNFTDGFRSCIKYRESSGRLCLWLLLGSSCANALTYEVYTNIMYVYAHHMYNWDPTIYSEVWTIFSFLELVVVLVCTPVLIKCFKLSDTCIGIIGSVSIMLKTVLLAVAYETWLYYLSNIFGFLNGLGNLAVRSLISKLVDQDELGRVFSFLATCEAIVPLLGSFVVAKIFNATIKVFPGACYFVATAFLLLPLFTFTFIRKIKSRYQSLKET